MTKINLLQVKSAQKQGRPIDAHLKVAREFGFTGNLTFSHIRGGAGIESAEIPWFRTEQGTFLIKRLKRMLSEQDVLYCMDYMRFLSQNGIPIPCASKIGTSGDSPYDFFVELDGEYFAMDRRAFGADFYTTTAPPHVFENAGALISRIHYLSQGFRTSYSRHPDYYSLSKAINASRGTTSDVIEESAFHGLPMSHIPSDLNFGNMKFDENGVPTAVFDWDNPRYGYRLEDVIATVSQSGRKGEGLNLRKTLVEDCIRPFIEGYNREAERNGYDKFSKKEIALLPAHYRINFLHRTALTGHPIFIRFLEQSDEIFASEAWRKFAEAYPPLEIR